MAGAWRPCPMANANGLLTCCSTAGVAEAVGAFVPLALKFRSRGWGKKRLSTDRHVFSRPEEDLLAEAINEGPLTQHSCIAVHVLSINLCHIGTRTHAFKLSVRLFYV